MRKALASWALFLTLLGGWSLYLRPPALGGTTTYVFVRGESMRPTYSPGDLVFVRRQPAYPPGSVVALRPVLGSPGIVLHRLVGQSDGRLITRGDNLDTDDPWRPTTDGVLGEAFFRIPRAGLLLGLLADPVPLGLVCGMLAALVTMGHPFPRGGTSASRRAVAWLGRSGS